MQATDEFVADCRRRGILDGTWQSEGICAQTDPEAFFPEKGGSVTEALRVCRGCPVADQCRDYGIVMGEPWGVWGGYGARALRKYATAHGLTVDSQQSQPQDQPAAA
jgi:hypothetical protein